MLPLGMFLNLIPETLSAVLAAGSGLRIALYCTETNDHDLSRLATA